MEKWTLIEAQSQHCTRSVVGTTKHYYPIDTLQHAWTQADAQAGRCMAEEIGTSRFPPYAALIPPADYGPPEIEDEVEDAAESEGPLNLVDALNAAHAHMGGRKAFLAWAAKNPQAVYPIMLKMGVAQVAKDEPAKLPDLDTLSPADIATLSSADLKRILLKSAGVTKKSDLQTE